MGTRSRRREGSEDAKGTTVRGKMSEDPKPPDENLKRLFDAMAKGEVDAIEALIEEDPPLLQGGSERGYTPVQFAVGEGKKEQREPMARLMIERGAEVDIHVACTLNMAERVAALLDADPSLLGSMNPDG